MKYSKKSEIPWTREICEYLVKTQGCKIRVIGGDFRAEKGWPDRLIVHWSGVYLVEFKDCTTKLAPEQKNILQALDKRQKGLAFIARKLDIHNPDAGVIYHPVSLRPLAVFRNKEGFLEALQKAQHYATSPNGSHGSGGGEQQTR